jgi:hypothetical protein
VDYLVHTLISLFLCLYFFCTYVDNAETFCSNCDMSFCEACAEVIHKPKMMQFHKLGPLQKRKPKCQQHEGYISDMYCESCKVDLFYLLLLLLLLLLSYLMCWFLFFLSLSLSLIFLFGITFTHKKNWIYQYTYVYIHTQTLICHKCTVLNCLPKRHNIIPMEAAGRDARSHLNTSLEKLTRALNQDLKTSEAQLKTKSKGFSEVKTRFTPPPPLFLILRQRKKMELKFQMQLII